MSGEGIALRVAVPAGKYMRVLRRFVLSPDRDCPAAYGYHNAVAELGLVPDGQQRPGRDDDHPHDKPGWPAECACGYQFRPEDSWQRADNEVYRLPDGTEFTLGGSLGMAAPPGTMIRVPWFDDIDPERGEAWNVVLPDGGEWITTQKARGGGHWTVTGTPPLITVSPSIWHNQPDGWHGWIRDGALVDA